MSLTIVIPSRNERFLFETVRDVAEKTGPSTEIVPVLDGYEPDQLYEHERVRYVRLPQVRELRKRHAINMVVEQSSCEFVMSLDAHCMVAPRFDAHLERDHRPGWVQIPRRHRLDPVGWCLQTQSDDRPPIDYEHTMWPLKFDPHGLHGFRWDARTLDRLGMSVDETMHFQGSCWFMERSWFKDLGLMQIEGYSGWGQEAEEIGLKTWRAGGHVITNKNTWYAHLHKGPVYGRMYFMNREWARACNRFSFGYWVMGEGRPTFEALVRKFWPVPGWPRDWEKRLWG